MPGLEIKPHLPWLAPLAGYSNLPFRLLCRSLGAYVACTEMVSAKGIYYSLRQPGGWPKIPLPAQINSQNGKGTWALLASPPDDAPLIVQLFGSDPETIQIAAESILELFAERDVWFDLNMGCAVPKVTKTGAGAIMLDNLPNALRVARALVAAAGPGRAGFKLRLGWQKGEDVYLDLGKRLADAGAAWLTLHPRYGRQAFLGNADWHKIGLLKQAVDIPIVASGDLLTARAALECLETSRADAVMFARGAMNNPFVFREFISRLKGREYHPPGPGELIDVIRHHAALARTWLDDRYALSQMRGFIPRYVHHFPGVRALRQRLTACQNWEQLDIVISEFMLKVMEAGD